jgi:hypothetical protein
MIISGFFGLLRGLLITDNYLYNGFLMKFDS